MTIGQNSHRRRSFNSHFPGQPG